jgi:hypothetical protein
MMITIIIIIVVVVIMLEQSIFIKLKCWALFIEQTCKLMGSISSKTNAEKK